jgi:hypothetical protein
MAKKLIEALNNEISDAPIPNYEENDYNAGYRDGLFKAIDWIAEFSVSEKTTCGTCKWRETDSYRFYTYPCRDCKYRSGDFYEPAEGTL